MLYIGGDFINYYNEIKNTLVKNEAYKAVKDYSKNKSDLNSYYEVGRLLVESQGGEQRAKYGNKLIKEYSDRLTRELGKGYSTRNLKYMRKFYLFVQKGHAVRAELSWTHYRILLTLNDIEKINYYSNISIIQNLGYREVERRIKNKEYERIGYKEELKEPKVNSLIKDPIIIKTNKKIDENIKEYTLHKLILEDMDNFLKELGVGFTYVGHEVKITIGNNYHSIDFLLFNIEFNCYICLEIKVTNMKAQYIGQIGKYMNYIDKNIKKPFHDKTVGVIICKKKDKYILEYCSDERIFTTTYKIKTDDYHQLV